MNRFVLAFIIVLLLFFKATGQKSRITITGLTPFNSNELVVVFKYEEDSFPVADALPIGILYSSDYESVATCNYFQVLELLKQHARDNGANLIRITEHKGPGFNTLCDRITAHIYRIDSAAKYETFIIWNKERKLSWQDFKGKPKKFANKNVPAEGVCGFSFQYQKNAANSKFHTYLPNVFYCKLSWVNKDSSNNPGALQFQQLCFDIHELYARHCRSRIEAENLNKAKNSSEAMALYYAVSKRLSERLEACIEETEYGHNLSKLKEWQTSIEEELKEYERYSDI